TGARESGPASGRWPRWWCPRRTGRCVARYRGTAAAVPAGPAAPPPAVPARAPRPAGSDRAGAAPPRARPAPAPRAGRPRATTAATAPGIDAPRRGWIGGYAMCARDLLELASNEGRPGGRPCLVLPAQAHGQLDRAGRTGDSEPGALAEVRIRLQADAPPVAEIGVVALVGDVEDVAAHAQAEAAARIPLLLHGQVELEEI